MFERFSLRTRRVLATAGAHARSMAVDHVRSEHLLVGLVAAELPATGAPVPGSVGALFTDRGIDRGSVVSCATTASAGEVGDGRRVVLAPFGELPPLSGVCRSVLRRAWVSADTRGHRGVEPEHVWASLTSRATSDCGALRALAACGVAAAAVQDRARSLLDALPAEPPATTTARDAGPELLPYPTPRYRQVLDAAREAAKARGHQHVGVEHLLLAILDDGMSVATAALTNAGVSLDHVQDELEAVVATFPAPDAPHRPSTTPT